MKFTVMLAVMLLSGCASMGLSTPKGFDQQLAEAYGVHTAVLQATTTAVTAGSLTSVEATQVKAQADSARALLDAARTADAAGNPAAGNSDLQLAVGALTALQTFLNAKGK